jgi:alkanesulfonate monooxygenase SsuD/methylene tetrahydromethanopterin reductase-like flavin-dependent oxidoreductase (luciferase family)
MSATPLAVLDLVPISSGSTASAALRNSIDLARHVERLGYQRYWFAEHHLNPGVAGTSPAVVLALTASATSRIRLGSGAVQTPYPTPAEARVLTWTQEDDARARDRLDTQFVGTPAQVADHLEVLRDATGADELAITTITHDHADRVRSYELLAHEWRRRATVSTGVAS